MALVSYNSTMKEWENIIRVNLKVTNPALLKSGALGILTNYLAGIKYDALQFYSKTFQEMNVGLAQDFNSMLYHTTIYGAELKFATPSTLSCSLVIPELNLSQIEELKYEIPRFRSFTDSNGIAFIFISDIKIVVTKGNLTAVSWNPEGTKNLTVTKAANPNSPGNFVYLIHNAEVQQYQRNFYNFITPEYVAGESFEFTIGMDNIRNLKEIKAWLNVGTSTLQVDELHELEHSELLELSSNTTMDYNLIPLNIRK